MGLMQDINDEKERESKKLKDLEVYCKNETCGDPVPGYGSKPAYTKRRMNFNRMTVWKSDAEFRCPVCGAIRKFRYSVLIGGNYEVN